MKKNSWAKKTIIGGMALALALGGSTAAFADGKGKGFDKDRNNKIETKYGNKGNSIELKLVFDDVKGKDVEWAIRYIASLASKRVFEGYEDGTFKPRQTITRIEAITAAVRLMGLRDKAESQEEMNSQLNFRDADKIKSQYPWAVGYVAVALENDLFEESDDAVQPDKPADRLWATTLLVKALKLQDEAKAKMNSQLNFRDADKIPAGSVGYVAVALEKNLIDGYEDNTFRPNRPVTRAELAALLDRTGSQFPDQGNFNVQGVVTAAVYNNVLTINKNGQSLQLTLDPNAFIFRNGTKVTAAELKPGDQIRANLYNGNVVFIEVTKAVDNQQADFTVNGTFNSYTLNSQGKIATISVNQTVNGSVQTSVYNVSPNLTIYGDLALLTAGRAVELKGNNQLVHTITIK